MKKKVEFVWWSSRKIWEVYGKNMEEITEKCMKSCYKYHTMHFQILD